MRALGNLILVPLVLVLLGGSRPIPGNKTTVTSLAPVNLSVKKVGKVWKVVLTGTTRTAVHVKKGQPVVFTAEGTDVYFQFDNAALFGGHTRYVKAGKKLTLGVGNVAKGIYTYAAFCAGPKVYAEGDSPPKIIVD